MAPDSVAVRFGRQPGGAWHLVNRAGASLCGAVPAAGGWQRWDFDLADYLGESRCGRCRGRAHWLRAERPAVPHADRAAYSRWLQVDWWLAGGLVFPAARQEGR